MRTDSNTPVDNDHDDTEAMKLPASLMLLPLPVALLQPLPKGRRSTISKRGRHRHATPAQRREHRRTMAAVGRWSR
jgi:hypothetical protein